MTDFANFHLLQRWLDSCHLGMSICRLANIKVLIWNPSHKISYIIHLRNVNNNIFFTVIDLKTKLIPCTFLIYYICLVVLCLIHQCTLSQKRQKKYLFIIINPVICFASKIIIIIILFFCWAVWSVLLFQQSYTDHFQSFETIAITSQSWSCFEADKNLIISALPI